MKRSLKVVDVEGELAERARLARLQRSVVAAQERLLAGLGEEARERFLRLDELQGELVAERERALVEVAHSRGVQQGRAERLWRRAPKRLLRAIEALDDGEALPALLEAAWSLAVARRSP